MQLFARQAHHVELFDLREDVEDTRRVAEGGGEDGGEGEGEGKAAGELRVRRE